MMSGTDCRVPRSTGTSLSGPRLTAIRVLPRDEWNKDREEKDTKFPSANPGTGRESALTGQSSR